MDSEIESHLMSSRAFDAYRALREIADKYNLEINPPRIVFVGETSTGKSMLVQNFLGFPCAFSDSGVATRCPVAYQLRYNPTVRTPRVIKPVGIEPNQLAARLGQHMKRIENESKFSTDAYKVEIESNTYPDLEIYDVPGLVGGDNDQETRTAVEQIVEFYVRDPNFIIVLLIDASQELVNSYGARRVHELCTNTHGSASDRQPRLDYQNNMLTIMTKFDKFMKENANGTQSNRGIQDRLDKYGAAVFVSMILDARAMSDESFESNVQYMKDLPQREKEVVDQWIENVVNAAANRPPTNYPKFDSAKYRHLIGIGTVREKIRSRWLQSFNMALPTLMSKLTQQLTTANRFFDDTLKEYEHSNSAQIRMDYLSYINEYRRKLAFYAVYKAEIDGYFPHGICATTYEDIEKDFMNRWPRRRNLIWRAYLSSQELKDYAKRTNNDDNSLEKLLNSKLLGSSQFHRLQKVFSYMVLAYKHEELTADEIVTLESLLYGGLSNHVNMEKFMRDTMYRLIRKTFAVGIAWLIQMYSYLLDTFREAVTKLLLSLPKYSYLRKHVAFLGIVELDYHRRVRSMIRMAIRAVRDTRFAYSTYVHYDLTAWLKKLSFRIPVEIQHNLYLQKIPNVFIKDGSNSRTRDHTSSEYREATIGELFAKIQAPRLLDFIIGSESYLTNKRDEKTHSHHLSARRTVDELYTATCARLVYDIAAHFNAHVVIGINQFNHIEPYSSNSIMSFLNSISEFKIARMANLDSEKIIQCLEHYKQQIGDLTAAKILLNGVTQQFRSSPTNTDTEHDQLKEYSENSRKRVMIMLDRKCRLINPEWTRSMLHTQQDAHEDGIDLQIDDRDAYEFHSLIDCHDPTISDAYLKDLYQCHDNEDLEASLLEGESLDQDELEPRAIAHLRLSNFQFATNENLEEIFHGLNDDNSAQEPSQSYHPISHERNNLNPPSDAANADQDYYSDLWEVNSTPLQENSRRNPTRRQSRRDH